MDNLRVTVVENPGNRGTEGLFQKRGVGPAISFDIPAIQILKMFTVYTNRRL
jgi:hypothetical protein